MKCPNCGNHKFERLDYAIVCCTNCSSLWDPYMYPGFPKPTVDIGQIWDTEPFMETDWDDEENEDELKDWDADEENEDGLEDWDEEEEEDY